MNTTFRDSASKPLFARGPGLPLNFFLLAVLSIGLMVADGVDSRVTAARAWAAWALQPLLQVAQGPTALAGLGDNFRGRDALLEENRGLKARQIELDGRLLKLDALEAENGRIRALLSSSAALPDRVLISEVLATSQDPYRHQIVLNRGLRDGAYKGQALVDAEGVMGQVIQVNPTTSVALLITDPDHGIPVEINRTGLETIALGRGDGQGLSLPYLPGNADVKVGDLLVSSGLGGRFPAGYPVGKVFELRHPAGENFMEALAYPSARLNQGRQALLVWSEHNAAPGEIVTVPIERPQPKRKATAAAPGTPAAAMAPKDAAGEAKKTPAPAVTAESVSAPKPEPVLVPADRKTPVAAKPEPVRKPSRTAAGGGKPAARLKAKNSASAAAKAAEPTQNLAEPVAATPAAPPPSPPPELMPEPAPAPPP